MALLDLLSDKKIEILERWRELVFDSYVPETARFLKSQKDRFANPIAYQLTRGLTGILEVILLDQETDQAKAQLDEVLRLKALQDASPSRAMAFIFVLKPVLREKLAQELEDPAVAGEMVELEARLDGLALLGFDAVHAAPGKTLRRQNIGSKAQSQHPAAPDGDERRVLRRMIG